MARIVGREIPNELAWYIRESPREMGRGVAVILVSIDEGGWPHIALLSLWEIALKTRRRIRLATFSGSTTTRNLQERRLLTLIFIDKGMTYYVKGVAHQYRLAEETSPPVVLFEIEVSLVTKEEEGVVEIESGVAYREERAVESHREVYELLSRK